LRKLTCSWQLIPPLLHLPLVVKDSQVVLFILLHFTITNIIIVSILIDILAIIIKILTAGQCWLTEGRRARIVAAAVLVDPHHQPVIGLTVQLLQDLVS
jgi:hypothetical protein